MKSPMQIVAVKSLDISPRVEIKTKPRTITTHKVMKDSKNIVRNGHQKEREEQLGRVCLTYRLLGESTPPGKHARWWSRIFSRGIQKVSIVYCAGKDNANSDALSRSPISEIEASELKSDMTIEATSGDGEENISSLLSRSPEALTQGHQMSTFPSGNASQNPCMSQACF